jgi:hypothetical protein
MFLYNNKHKKIAEAIIDKEDYEKVKDYKWHKGHSNYIVSAKNGIRLHRLIMNYPSNMEIDHKNHNKLDNRKENLRVCTGSQNKMNGKIHKDNFSKFKGVSWNKKNNKWVACIYTNNKNKFLGCFNNKIDAAIAYNNAALKYYGEFALLNKI